MARAKKEILKELKEPFATFKKMEILAEEGRALYVYEQVKYRKRKYADIGEELGVSRARVERLMYKGRKLREE